MKILFSTGELSGENYAIGLKKVLEKRYDSIEFIGIGSNRLEMHDIKPIGDVSLYSTIGFTDVIKNIFPLREIVNSIKRAIKKEKPDLIIFIDAPALNLRLIPYVKKLKIKSVYLFPPQVWAWGRKRLSLLKLVNKLIVAFPFEEKFYKENGLKAEFLGHPLIDMIKVNPEYVSAFREKFDENTRFVGVFPGSRISEINNHMPILRETLEEVSAKFKDIIYLISVPTSEIRFFIEKHLTDFTFPFEIIISHPYEVMDLSEFIITSSGTATLEATILEVPEIIFYRLSVLNWLMAKVMVKVKYIGLPNLIHGRLVVPELVQWRFNPSNLEYLMIKFLIDPKVLDKISNNLRSIKGILGENGVLDKIGESLTPFIT